MGYTWSLEIGHLERKSISNNLDAALREVPRSVCVGVCARTCDREKRKKEEEEKTTPLE